MKKITILFTFIAFSILSKAQINTDVLKVPKPIVNAGSPQYNLLKGQGKLFHYEVKQNPGAAPTIVKTSYKPNAVTNATLTPCDPIPPGTTSPFPVNPTLDDDTYFDQNNSYINLPFSFCFYGVQYNQVNYSSNGNIQFPPSNNQSFSATGFPTATDKMIAPFWADFDNRGVNGGTYLIDIFPTFAVFTWTNMGYFNSQVNKKNTVQLIITNGSDPILPPGNNIGFYYGNMEWTTGGANAGVNGFPGAQPGTPATVGINAGDGINYFLIGRFGVPGVVYDGPFGNSDGVAWLSNKRFFFNSCPAAGSNTEPNLVSGGGYCDTLKICSIGDTLVYTTSFSGPEPGQTVTVTATAPTLGTSFVPLGITTSSTGVTNYSWMVIASASVGVGPHTVFVTGTDDGFPALSTTIPYIVKIKNVIIPTPTISVSPVGPVCATPGATISILNNTDYDVISWSTGTFGPTALVNSAGIFYYTLQKTGCFRSFSGAVLVNPNPEPSILGALNYCLPATSTTLGLNPPTNGSGAYTTYTWNPISLNTATVDLTGAAAGTSYTVLVTDANGCIGRTRFVVSSGSPTLSIIATPTAICGTGTVNLSTSSSAATNFIWSTSEATPTISISSGGTYTVGVLINGCPATAARTVVFNPLPIATLASTLGICDGSTAVLITPTISPTVGPYTYNWSNGATTSTVAIGTTTTIALQVKNTATGCISIFSNTCTIITAPNPTVTLGNSPIIFCDGLNATLTPTITSGTPNYAYNWTPSSLGTNSVVNTSNAGTYTVLVTDRNLCKGIATVTTVKSSPTSGLSIPTLICPGASRCTTISATANSNYTPFVYTWSNDITNTSLENIVCQAGVITFTFTDAQGCVSISTTTVSNDVIPTANFTTSPPSPVKPGDVITFVNTSTISAGTISSGNWSFGDGNSGIGDNVTHAYTTVGNYPITLYVTSSNFCRDSIQISYVVDAVTFAPNVITPNGDNVNDFLKFNNLASFTTNNLVIFNRWGKKIYEKDNYKNDWNGSGHEDGTYFYVLTIPDAKPTTYKNFVQLITK